MATKKAKAETIEVAPQQAVVKPTTKQQVKKPSWEIKDRTYVLKGEKSPITFKIPSKHTQNTLYCILIEITIDKERLGMLQINHQLC